MFDMCTPDTRRCLRIVSSSPQFSNIFCDRQEAYQYLLIDHHHHYIIPYRLEEEETAVATSMFVAVQLASIAVSLAVLVLFQASVGEGKPFHQLGT